MAEAKCDPASRVWSPSNVCLDQHGSSLDLKRHLDSVPLHSPVKCATAEAQSIGRLADIITEAR